MCGICGMVGVPDDEALARMIATLAHRGPDDAGTFRDHDAAFAFRRLSIIDLKGAHQPMADETGQLHMMCNGEIYNYRELRAELVARGHRLSTAGDCEVILHLYQEMGERCVDPLNGMFAFAIWDAQAKSLLLARDRIGVKPMYYTVAGATLLFASEMKALLAHPAVRREIDPESLDLYLAFRYVPAPRTILKNIFKLMPGHTLTFAEKRITVRKYWDLPETVETGEVSRDDVLEELNELLADSVRLELVSDVPLGVYLSGGLDSSVLTAVTAGAQKRPVETFSVGFAERGFDERPYARSVAQYLHANHHELVSEKETSFDELSHIIWHLDEPVADAAAIPTFQMARLTKEHVTVVLTGEGADELFAGYPYYKFYVWTDRLRKVLKPLGYAGSRHWRTAGYLQSLHDRAAAYLALKAVFTPRQRARLYEPNVARKAGASRAEEIVSEYLVPGAKEDYLQQLLRLDVKLWLPDDLLTKVDRMTMAHAVEARVPYLDHRVVEFMYRLPSSMKLHGHRSKYLLRLLGERLLPRSAAHRPKRGFAVPLAKWLHDSEVGANILSKDSIRRRGLFRVEPVRRLVEKHKLDLFARRQLWALVCFEMWCRAFLDGDPANPPVPVNKRSR